MRKTVLFGFVTLMLVVLAACGKVQAPPEIGVAATRTAFQFSGKGASANFTNTEGCISTGVTIAFSETQPGEVDPVDSFGFFFLDTFNTCTEEYLSAFSGDLGDANFSIDERLTTATLTATFEGCRYTFEEACGVPVELTMRWTGEGKLSRGRSSTRETTPTFTRTESFKGISRSADVTGKLTVGGESINLSAFDSSEGVLNSGEFRIVVIEK